MSILDWRYICYCIPGGLSRTGVLSRNDIPNRFLVLVGVSAVLLSAELLSKSPNNIIECEQENI